MWDIAYYLALVLLLAVATIAGAFLVRAYLAGTHPLEAFGTLWAQRPEKRLFVVEQSNLDGRRRLILIRRDDVEHLIMTGGPVDVVIETGISVPVAPPHEPLPEARSSAAAATRTPLRS